MSEGLVQFCMLQSCHFDIIVTESQNQAVNGSSSANCKTPTGSQTSKGHLSLQLLVDYLKLWDFEPIRQINSARFIVSIKSNHICDLVYKLKYILFFTICNDKKVFAALEFI